MNVLFIVEVAFSWLAVDNSRASIERYRSVRGGSLRGVESLCGVLLTDARKEGVGRLHPPVMVWLNLVVPWSISYRESYSGGSLLSLLRMLIGLRLWTWAVILLVSTMGRLSTSSLSSTESSLCFYLFLRWDNLLIILLDRGTTTVVMWSSCIYSISMLVDSLFSFFSSSCF